MGKNFTIKSEFKPSGDQPEAISSLCSGLVNKKNDQVLLELPAQAKHLQWLI